MAKMGRPLITLKDLPENWEKDILELAKKGGSIVEIAVLLEISRDTFYALSERDEYFSDTVKKCKQLSEAWWVKKGRTELDNKDFSFTGWYMNMKNRFGWADKVEQKTDIRASIADLFPDELKDEEDD
jgi:hypothetical protein